MTKFKRYASFMVAFLIIISCFGFNALADNDNWLFIQGENINRAVDTAVIYRDVKTTGQTKWGYNVVLDENYTVTQIIQSGDSAGEDLAVPNRGAVISASGKKVEWLKDNVAVGDVLYYDSYTQRLFVCDGAGNFSSDVNKSFAVVSFRNDYFAITEEEGIETYGDFVYGIVIQDGIVVKRGGNLEIGENQIAVFATTDESKNQLIMNAPVGAKCVLSENTLNITFNSTCYGKTGEILISDAKALLEKSKAEYDNLDYEKLENIISKWEEANKNNMDYKSFSEMAFELDSYFKINTSEKEIFELRSAFHVPTEKSDREVRATVISAKAAGLNSIILRVSNGYGTFVPMPADAKFAQDAAFGGFDVLKSFIEVCEKEKITLTLCFDVYYNQYASVAAPKWTSKTNGGETGLYNKYFSPANEEFKSYYLNYVNYIISNYNIKSVMFDYLRYPKYGESTDLGYDDATLNGFQAQSGIDMGEIQEIKTLLHTSPHWKAWVEYRQGIVDSMAKDLCAMVRENRGDITLLAAIERDTVDYFYMQNSLGWIEEKLFDGYCVNVYNKDVDEGDLITQNAYYDGIIGDKCGTFAQYIGKESFLFVGVDSNLPINGDVVNSSVLESREIGSDGFIFSSLSEFVSQNYPQSMADGVFSIKSKAMSPFGNTVDVMKSILDSAKHEIYENIRVLGGCDEETALAALEKIDSVLESMGDEKLSYQDAKDLENQMAVIFASANGKQKALENFENITKLALLSKDETELQNPQPEESDNVSEESHQSQDETEESQSENMGEISEESGNVENQSDGFSYNGPSVGVILMYVFVGITAISVIIAMVVGVRRKNTVSPKHHMPKGYDKKDE